MTFENPKIKEGINVSQEHPLKEFFQLALALIGLVIIAIVTLHFSAGFFATKIPFSYETKMLAKVKYLHVESSSKQKALQQLADKLVPYMNLPQGMNITVHYSDEPTVNAFATLGGHVFFYQGLIEKLHSEDALAMVMAHEIAHVKHRHPIVAMGKGVTLMTLAAALTGTSGSRAGEILIGQTLNVSLLKFSRDQEAQSDKTAASVLYQHYGHLSGAKELFDLFLAISTESKISENLPSIFLSHPHNADRWSFIEDLANAQGWQIEGSLTALGDWAKEH